MCLEDAAPQKPFPWDVRQIRRRLELFVNTVLGGPPAPFCKLRYLQAVNRFSGLDLPVPSTTLEHKLQMVLLQGPSPNASQRAPEASAELLQDAFCCICSRDRHIGELVRELIACAVCNRASTPGAFLGSSMSAIGIVWLDDSLAPNQLAREVAHEAIHTVLNMHDALFPLFKPTARSMLSLSCVKHCDRPYDMSLHAAVVHAGLIVLGLAQYEHGINTAEGTTVAQPECTAEGLRVFQPGKPTRN